MDCLALFPLSLLTSVDLFLFLSLRKLWSHGNRIRHPMLSRSHTFSSLHLGIQHHWSRLLMLSKSIDTPCRQHFNGPFNPKPPTSSLSCFLEFFLVFSSLRMKIGKNELFLFGAAISECKVCSRGNTSERHIVRTHTNVGETT
jgi:hypothetical protein